MSGRTSLPRDQRLARVSLVDARARVAPLQPAVMNQSSSATELCLARGSVALPQPGSLLVRHRVLAPGGGPPTATC